MTLETNRSCGFFDGCRVMLIRETAEYIYIYIYLFCIYIYIVYIFIYMLILDSCRMISGSCFFHQPPIVTPELCSSCSIHDVSLYHILTENCEGKCRSVTCLNCLLGIFNLIETCNQIPVLLYFENT